MPVQPPQTVAGRNSLAAIDEALQKPWSIRQYEQVAMNEANRHLQRVKDVKAMFVAAANVIGGGAKKLKDDTVTLAQTWRDKNFGPAFEGPVTGYLMELEKSRSRLAEDVLPGGVGHMTALDQLATKIPGTHEALRPLLDEQGQKLRELVTMRNQILSAMQTQESLGQGGLPGVNIDFSGADPIIDRLEEIDRVGHDHIQTLDTAYKVAANQIRVAATHHKFDGPAAGQAPANPNLAPNAPGGPGGPGGGPSAPSTAPPGGGPQPETPQQSPGGQPPGGQPPGGQPPGGGAGEQPPGGGAGEQPPGGGAGDPTVPGSDTPLPDTGLAGAPPATLPPSTVPDLPTTSPNTPNLPGSTSPGGTGPLGGIGGGGPLAAGLGGSSRPGTGTGAGGNVPNVQQAARELSTPQGAGTGQAPALGRLATGSATPAGSGFSGVPPMMPPMMPQAGGGSGKPKPGTAPATGTGRSRPAGGSAGVPAGLRGRTGGGDGQRRPAVRRARQEAEQAQASQPNQNVELLDSELWEVEQPSPVTERRRVREY